MNNYIEQMAREVWRESYRLARGAGYDWDDKDDETKDREKNAIVFAFQSLWIDIAEHGLPEEEKPVWFCEEGGTIHRGSYEGDGAWWDEDEMELISANVTHYMPVFTPPPPKGYETETPS